MTEFEEVNGILYEAHECQWSTTKSFNIGMTQHGHGVSLDQECDICGKKRMVNKYQYAEPEIRELE